MKPKFRLHAHKVDRIAIVDRPAVPNAQIVLFKRKKDIQIPKALEFNEEFLLSGTEGAVIALENSFWSTMFDDEMNKSDKVKAIDTMFNDFSKTVNQIISLTKGLIEKFSDEPTPEDIARGFSDRVRMTAISDSFMLFRQHLGFFVVNSERIEDSMEVIKKLIETMKVFIQEQADMIIEKKIAVDPTLVIDKEGRVISSSRLRRLKQAMLVIEEIIGEAEKPKDKKEATVELQELIKMFEEFKTSFEALTKSVAEIQGKLDAEPEYVKTFTDRLDALEKKIGESGEVVSAEQLAQNRADIEGIITEGQKALEEKAEVEKKEKEDTNARIEKAEKVLEQVVKGFDNLSKRMGSKKGLELDKNDDGASEDVFNDALKQKKKE